MLLPYLVSYALIAALALAVLALVHDVARGRGRPSARDDDQRAFRRCMACNARWRAVDGREYGRLSLAVRRAVRHSRRRLHLGRSRVPASWSRCPSCLSRTVRPSRVQDEVSSERR